MNLKVADAKREEGFTLIELLVVVIIIGILAAIAIPIFLNQREKARDSAVESTLRSAATYMEIYYTENVDIYTEAVADLVDQGFRAGNVEGLNIQTDGPAFTTYCIEGHHAGDDQRVFSITTDSTDDTAGAPHLRSTDGTAGCDTDGTASGPPLP